MRAWSLRQLGLGSSLLSDTIPATSFRDRFGDMQLETNLEYRFNIATVNGIKIGSALFADIGNVWNLKKDAAIALARLIIQYGSDKNFDLYTGTEGVIKISKNQSKSSSSVLLLTASYLDHGINSKNRKEGKAMMKIYLKQGQ